MKPWGRFATPGLSKLVFLNEPLEGSNPLRWWPFDLPIFPLDVDPTFLVGAIEVNRPI
jgi:hypothetical protein